MDTESLLLNRNQFIYPFDGNDYQSDITDDNKKIEIDLKFQLPYYRFHYNYIRVSIIFDIFIREYSSLNCAIVPMSDLKRKALKNTFQISDFF